MHWTTVATAVAVAGVAGCGGGSNSGPEDATLIQVRSVAHQVGLSGAPVAAPPSVRLTRSGAGVGRMAVTFAIASGGGTLEGGSQVTDGNGVATVGSWKLGRIGVNSLTASAAAATGSPVTFQAVADGGPSMQARYFFADSVNVGTVAAPQWVPAGIRGDGRARDGSPVAVNLGGEYQGSFCGVSAVIGRGPTFEENSDFYFNPGRFWSDTLPGSCKPKRSYQVYVDGPNAPPREASPLAIIGGVQSMSVGETQVQRQVFQDGAAGLGGLWFDDAYPPASSLVVTRLPDIVDELGRPVRQWRLETRSTHRAAWNGRTDITYYLPFSLTVTEVPHPFPRYP